MTDRECVEFLRWALPVLRLRWPGFRRVRRQVAKRIARRMAELRLADGASYRAHLETHPDEWLRLDALCRISISRFRRDRAVWHALGEQVLPELARLARSRGDPVLRCWSAGCASGEEAYSLAILWHLELRARLAGLPLRVTATDADSHLLERARDARFGRSSLKEVPAQWLAEAFEPCHGGHRVRARYREGIVFEEQDVRREVPEGPFHLVLCRNLVCTYFEESLQTEILTRIRGASTPGGALVLGIHEALPKEISGYRDWLPRYGIYRADDAG